MGKKGQSAIELIMIVGVVIVFFIIFMIILIGNLSDSSKKKEELYLKDLALQVQSEIHLASESSDGYIRDFRLPLNLQGRAYMINITDSRVWVRTDLNSISLNVEDVKGDIKKGNNTIRKNQGIVYLNQ